MSEPDAKFSSIFNQVVRRHRLARRLSQEKLSEHAEVDRTYVGLLERGRRSAGLDVAHRIAEALGISFTDLIAETEAEWQQGRVLLEVEASLLGRGERSGPRAASKRGRSSSPRRPRTRR